MKLNPDHCLRLSILAWTNTVSAAAALGTLAPAAWSQTVPSAQPLPEPQDEVSLQAETLALPIPGSSIELKDPVLEPLPIAGMATGSTQVLLLDAAAALPPTSLLERGSQTASTEVDIVGQTAPTEIEPVGQPPSLQTQPLSPGQLPFEPKKELLQRSVRYSPSITLLTPSAYGKSWRQFSVGASFQSRVRYKTESDALIGLGFGLGDSLKAVGLDVSIGINDVSGFERGAVGFKLHRRLPDQWAIAVGVNNALTWGKSVGGISPYGVVTKGFQLREDIRAPFSQLYVSAGAGTGRYRPEDDILQDRNSVGVFGSVAVRVVEQVNFITEWSGQDLSLGFSVLPFPKVPVVISPLVTDVTGTAGDGPRFAFSVGFGFTF